MWIEFIDITFVDLFYMFCFALIFNPRPYYVSQVSHKLPTWPSFLSTGIRGVHLLLTYNVYNSKIAEKN
jgi:hypothetical protein